MNDASTKQAETDKEGGDFSSGFVLYDRYEIQKALGAGGFAVVYAAFDRTIERQVAIKVLNIYSMVGSQQETDEVLQRFLREARVAAKIRHPSSIEIYDFGLLEGGERPYIIMEFLKGWDLDQELQERGPLPSERLFPLFCGALDALAEAHDKGVIHKDLKPANLFWSRPHTEHETLKVVDFGIAHVNAPGKKRLTQTGVMSGTPEYLPPEYIEEQSVTEMMDIYQMGLTLVEALSGVPVVQAPSPYQAAFKHVEGDLNIPPEFQEGAFGELLDKALAMDPEDRFKSAGDFSEALAAIDPSTVLLASMADTQRVEGFPSPVMNEGGGLWEDSDASTTGDKTEQSARVVVQDESAQADDAEDTLIEPMTDAEKEVVAAESDGSDEEIQEPETLEEESVIPVDSSAELEEVPEEPKTLEEESFVALQSDDDDEADSDDSADKLERKTIEEQLPPVDDDSDDEGEAATIGKEIVPIKGKLEGETGVKLEGNTGVKIEQDALFGAEKRESKLEAASLPTQSVPSAGIPKKVTPDEDQSGSGADENTTDGSSSKLLVAAVISVGIMIILGILVVMTVMGQ